MRAHKRTHIYAINSHTHPSYSKNYRGHMTFSPFDTSQHQKSSKSYVLLTTCMQNTRLKVDPQCSDCLHTASPLVRKPLQATQVSHLL